MIIIEKEKLIVTLGQYIHREILVTIHLKHIRNNNKLSQNNNLK